MSKKIFYSFIVAFLSILQLSAQKSKTAGMQEWKNDAHHSMIGFCVKHLNVAYIWGNFKNYSIKVDANESDLSDMQVEVTVETNSIYTGVEARDNHLRSVDFFDVEKYPQMTFKSTSYVETFENTGILKGNLTLHGITKPIELTVHFLGKVKNAMADNIEVVGFNVVGQIDRLDFGVGKDFPNNIISDKVDIILNLEFSPINK